MNLTADLVAPGWVWLGNLSFLGLLALAVLRAPWRWLAGGNRQHVFAGAAVACMLLWTISARIGSGPSFHLLGATLLTLTFGAWLAFVAGGIALAGISIAGLASWQTFGLNGLVMAGVPIAVSHAIYRWADTRLPNHLFVYVFVSAFFNGAAAMMASRLATRALVWLHGTVPDGATAADYMVASVLLSWGEALLTGMLMTVLVVYRPAWVRLFDDARYIAGR